MDRSRSAIDQVESEVKRSGLRGVRANIMVAGGWVQVYMGLIG